MVADCTKCGFKKSDEEFTFENGKRKSICKFCKAGYSRLRYYIKTGREIPEDHVQYLPAIGNTNSVQIRREFFEAIRGNSRMFDLVEMTAAERAEFCPQAPTLESTIAPAISNIIEPPIKDSDGEPAEKRPDVTARIMELAFNLTNGPIFAETLVYVIRLLPMQYFKVGKFTGTRDSLYAEYRRIGDPEIIYIHRTTNALQLEQEFHRVMADKAIIRRSIDAKGTKTEAYTCPEYEIMETLISLVRKDTIAYNDRIIAEMTAVLTL